MASVELFRGNPGQVVYIQEATGGAANDFYAGDLVKTDSSGQVVIATAGAIFGIARKTALGDDGYLEVELINYNSVYKIFYKSSGTAVTLVGDVIDATFTPGAHTWDESGATTDAMVVELIDPANTTGGALGIRFLPGAVDDNREGRITWLP